MEETKVSTPSECEQLKMTKYVSIIHGIWPFMFENNAKKKKWYNIYSIFMIQYLIGFIICIWIKLFFLLQETTINIFEIFANISYSITYIVNLWRTSLLKKPVMKQMFQDIIDWEKKVFASKDSDIINIYYLHLKKTKFHTQLYMSTVFLVTTAFLIRPLVFSSEETYDAVTNETVFIQTLPFPSWFPINCHKHHTLCYVIQTIDLLIGAVFLVSTVINLFVIIFFILGEMVILNYVLLNFDYYVQKVQNQLKVNICEADAVTLRECIIFHQKIIRHINTFNEELRLTNLFDFLHHALVVIVGFVCMFWLELTHLEIIFYDLIVTEAFFRIYINYWNGTDIIIESSSVGSAICNSNWYEESNTNQRKKLIMMLKSTKPKGLEIGPVGVLSLKTYLWVFALTVIATSGGCYSQKI
ncbi:uncharacterized protein [Diabrotica undecimpunctata]|uniref:uncharacterized protein n=1 Tax=Diabrotica undecimpunctata TaxID=50387 RepID=UPI003B63D155